MPAIETVHWLALKRRIDTIVTDPVMPFYEPGAEITAPSDTTAPSPYGRISDVRNDPDRGGRVDPSLHIHSGTLMLAVHWPIARDITHAQLVEIGGQIASHFPADDWMKYGPSCLRVIEAPSVMQPYRQDQDLVIVIRVRWRTA